MDKKSFLQAGHTPTLLAAFLYFDLAFMVWVLLGPLGVGIARDLGLSHAEKGLMVATPVLAGALLRIVMGILVDRLSPKKAAIIGQVIVIAAMAYAWVAGVHSYAEVLVLGLFLGVAGASFAAALPLASRWYPAEHQGTAMGIAGAGNSGTALAALFAPGLAAAFGWTNVFGIVLIPLVIVLIAFVFMAKDAPDAPPPKTLAEYLKVLKDKDAWWFMFFYSVTFGGFVGLASSLVIYFNTQYGLDPKMAGFFTAGCVFAGSLVRPIGGNDNATALVIDVLALPRASLRDSLENAASLPLPHRLKVGHEIDGLVVEEVLHDARETLLYRVRSLRNGQQLVLKTLQPALQGDACASAALLMEE